MDIEVKNKPSGLRRAGWNPVLSSCVTRCHRPLRVSISEELVGFYFLLFLSSHFLPMA